MWAGRAAAALWISKRIGSIWLVCLVLASDAPSGTSDPGAPRVLGPAVGRSTAHYNGVLRDAAADAAPRRGDPRCLADCHGRVDRRPRSEEHTSELQLHSFISY